ncbi:MAG: hypothetical protein PHY14_03355 [Candidatus Gracilibacteria bacterium]|nr:hypothetical protein [Candidatus Gracilibacteria bacterium]
MLTRTQERTTQKNTEIIEQKVNERGFYLYEWISQEELRMTLDSDYLKTVRVSSIPLAIIVAIVGFIGFAGGILGTILAVLGVLGIFYLIVSVILFIRFIGKSYLYTRGANVVITDNHYIQGGKILEKNDIENIRNSFTRYEDTFHEKFLGESGLAEKKELEKKALFDNLKEVAMGGGKILENVGRSRDSGGIVLVILVAGFLYSFMMGAVYFIGIFFIAIFGNIFSWLANKYLLATSNTEHTIQTLFGEIDESAQKIEIEKENTINLLDEASQNAWQENLLGKINESTKLLGEIAGDATSDTVKLRNILEQSKYKDIFNFVKYGNWVKRQILEPIESILLLLETNHATIEKTIISLDAQISETSDPSLQKPLELQKERLILQKESFERVIGMLEGYKGKLI